MVDIVTESQRKGRKKRTRSGVHALKTLVSMRGLDRIDQRTLAGKALIAWRSELIDALGGIEAISPQRVALIDSVVRTKLYMDCLDRFLLSQRDIVNKRKKAVVPALRERTQLAESLARSLGQLGLDRVEKDNGALPPEWIERVLPHDEPEPETKGAPHVDECKNR